MAVADMPITPQALAGHLYRVVESQEQIATKALVDTLEEQALLENLLESSKPPRPPDTDHLHYLLATPFRYPPLMWGSRFGRTHERGMLYGSLTLETVLAELAYYRLVFWQGMAVPPPGPVNAQHLVFQASYATGLGVDLTKSNWADHHPALAHPGYYQTTQALGSQLREQSIEAIEFLSARALQTGQISLPYDTGNQPAGVNVALFTPVALTSQQPEQQRRLLSQIHADRVEISLSQPQGGSELFRFSTESFLVGGRLPLPAR